MKQFVRRYLAIIVIVMGLVSCNKLDKSDVANKNTEIIDAKDNAVPMADVDDENDKSNTTDSVASTIDSTLENTVEPTARPLINPNYSVMYSVGEVNVRYSDSVDAKIYKKLSDNTKVYVVSEGNVWCKIFLDNKNYYVATKYLTKKNPKAAGKIVAIDAAHQEKCDSSKEAIGPGAVQKKDKVSSGTCGVATGLEEYELTLKLAKKLKKELEDRGYKVVMIREKNDVNISNSERANIANKAKADAFIRIHANNSEYETSSGAMTICQTANNPYNAKLYSKCREFSEIILDNLVNTTNCKKEYVYETDGMSGVNWCQVPFTIVEVGYMTNHQEDKLLSTTDYQDKITRGLANGIEQFLQAGN